MQDRVQDFASMLRSALGERVDQDARTFVDMLSTDALMEFPFAPPGFPARLEGRGDIAQHLEDLGRLIAFDRIGPANSVASEGDVTVIAFAASGRGLATGSAYPTSPPT